MGTILSLQSHVLFEKIPNHPLQWQIVNPPFIGFPMLLAARDCEVGERRRPRGGGS